MKPRMTRRAGDVVINATTHHHRALVPIFHSISLHKRATSKDIERRENNLDRQKERQRERQRERERERERERGRERERERGGGREREQEREKERYRN